ncbi:T-cell activation Rho GTPase-activating protein-like, partial [Buteo buteo]|uniref:T-cell activation Rho GTPase-activating protein-like n=1 Tax=Buteo buteo TaxID=30397 RepID=UPI003EB7D8A1
ALFGQPLAALCGEDGSLPRPIQELLAVLHREGPSTEGIFRRAASGTEFRELREAMDHGADVDLGSQPALLLAVILKVSASDLQLEELLPGLECSEAHLEPLHFSELYPTLRGPSVCGAPTCKEQPVSSFCTSGCQGSNVRWLLQPL